MAALVIRSLNILLGIFFSFLGTLKITPAISRELHKVGSHSVTGPSDSVTSRI